MNNTKSLTRETAAGRNNQVREGAARILFLAAACVSILAVLLITVFLLVSGVPAIAEIGVFKFLFGTVWKPGNDIFGILPMILGSIYVTAGALVLGVPIGVLTAIFLSRFASRRMVSVVKPAVQLLAGIPSVVYGFFGLVVIVPLLGGRGSMLAASVVLAIMILPTVITVSESSLNAV
ncbi:MAG: phosphate ABC transporter permease subunit PstC, partial [Alphaproteobacteria bacterium]|nr:phosphate ABC transporter permease subunit PstC [Alphaproteobacteria bacterium]